MTYIVLLRGINVAGKNKILMNDFVHQLIEEQEFESVKSYIQSGNFVIKSSIKTSDNISLKIKKIILEKYQYKIDVFSFTLSEFTKIINTHPFEIKEKQNYIAFINKKPEQEYITDLSTKNFNNDCYQVTNKAIHVVYSVQYSKSKLNNNYLEKQLKIISTMRNWNTVQKLILMANDL